MRSVATLIAVSGHLDYANLDAVLNHLCRFPHLNGPLILDVTGADDCDSRVFERLVSAFGAECHFHSVDWVLVGDRWRLSLIDEQLITSTDSVDEALKHFVRAIHSRRRMPLIRGGNDELKRAR